MGHYHSISSAIFARITNQRLAAERARHAGRQTAHDAAASARAAEKRAAKRHAIANRPRGRTEAIGHRADGRPIYRAIHAFRTRPYTPPADRKERPEPTIVAVNGWRYNVRPTAERIAAALKAEAPQAPYGPDTAPVTWRHILQRIKRKDANRRKARRCWR